MTISAPSPDRPASAVPRPINLIVASVIVLGIFTIIFALTAWVSDDSLITLAQVWNAIHGLGFTIDPGSRIQAFTHPLWVLLLTAASFVTRELIVTNLVISFLSAIGSIGLVAAMGWRTARTVEHFWFALVPLVFLGFSQAFTHYMSSGLENPLAYFIVALIAFAGLDLDQAGPTPVRRPYLVAFLCALLVLTRLDFALIALPVGLVLIIQLRRPGAIALLLLVAGLPVLAWLIFATIYFGMPLPTTFYAKLQAGFATSAYLFRGAIYLRTTIQQDAITAFMIVAALCSVWWTRSWLLRALMLGTLLYLAYAIRSGGDFMLGRFFAVLLLVSVIALTVLFARGPSLARIVLLVPFLMAVGAGAQVPLLSNPQTDGADIPLRPIVDERRWYYDDYGLLSPTRDWPVPAPPTGASPTTTAKTCGGFGIAALTRQHILTIDECALGDPFIARLPAIRDPKWRTGHAIRRIPEGYPEYRLGQRPTLADPGLQPLVEDVMLASRGDLFDPARWAAIWRLNVTFPYSFDRDVLTAPEL